MLPHTFANLEVETFYQNEPNFNGVIPRNNLRKIKDGTYVRNLDEYESVETLWIVLYVTNNNVTYFERSGVEHILKELKNFQETKISKQIFIVDLMILC